MNFSLIKKCKIIQNRDILTFEHDKNNVDLFKKRINIKLSNCTQLMYIHYYFTFSFIVHEFSHAKNKIIEEC